MKVILDENVPQKLRLLIGEEHSVVTTWYQGWSSFKNGALLNAAEKAGFVADRADLWWSPKQPDQAALWRSVVVLGERFFEEACNRPCRLTCERSRRCGDHRWHSTSTVG